MVSLEAAVAFSTTGSVGVASSSSSSVEEVEAAVFAAVSEWFYGGGSGIVGLTIFKKKTAFATVYTVITVPLIHRRIGKGWWWWLLLLLFPFSFTVVLLVVVVVLLR